MEVHWTKPESKQTYRFIPRKIAKPPSKVAGGLVRTKLRLPQDLLKPRTLGIRGQGTKIKGCPLQYV